MVYKGIKKGKYISMRAVDVSDAYFTSKLRADKDLCKYVHQVDASIYGQTEYIRKQRCEAGDYYFIIESNLKEPIGTSALYHFGEESAEMGRWVSYGNAFENIESVVLIHDIAFEELKLKFVFTCTSIDNENIINFWKRFGGDNNYIEEQSDFTAYKNIVSKETFYKTIRPRMIKVLRYEKVLSDEL